MYIRNLKEVRTGLQKYHLASNISGTTSYKDIKRNLYNVLSPKNSVDNGVLIIYIISFSPLIFAR